MLMCGAQFECAHNTADVDADTQATLRGKSNIFDVDFPIDGLRRLCIDPHSMSENAALEGTPLTLFAASPLLRGVPQFKRYAKKGAAL
ncbi:MAG: hypothetical protein AABY47_06975 [Pseudomonadota bacterium]